MKKRQIFPILLAAVLLLGLCPAVSAAYVEMTFSDELVAYIKQGEGFVSQPIYDSTGAYIGYGCLVNPADYPNGITEPEAEALLRERMQSFADYVNNFCKKYGVAVTQGQFDAMCGMSYALGPAWLQKGNRLPDYLIGGIDNYTDQQIASAFAAWCHVGSSVNTVALRRRIMEAKMFLDDDYSFTADGWSWLILNADGGKNAQSDVAVYRSGEPYGTLPAASKSGMYFAGWQAPDGSVLAPEDVVSGNLNVKALWSSTPVEQPSVPEPTPEPSPAPEEPPAPPEPPAESVGTVFPDVPDGEWYTDYVAALVVAGVVNGYDDGYFYPKNSVTWGQALKLILLAAGYPEQEPTEVKEGEAPSHWASGYLSYAEKKAFVSKGSVTDLDAAITRNDMADLCAAALELTETASPNPYADSSRASVLKLFAAGIMEGSFEGEQRVFKGKNAITRAEICAVLVRVINYVEQNLILFGAYRIPIDFDLRFCSYDPDSFYTENGRTYYDDGVTAVRCGIDVSQYQSDIDWAAVAADGIDFAMLRCGYRGYSKGALSEDPYFRKNISEALANGLDVGVYFFSQALSEAEAREEAEYCLELIEGYDLRFPVVFDWEPVTNYGSRTRSWSGLDVADFAAAFCDTVAGAGYTPMVYFNLSLAYLNLDLAKIQNYANWLARYADTPDYPYDFQMWQYGSSGKVAGISGRCDMDIAFVDFVAE